jgi:hypothetical protein
VFGIIAESVFGIIPDFVFGFVGIHSSFLFERNHDGPGHDQKTTRALSPRKSFPEEQSREQNYQSHAQLIDWRNP